MNNRKVAKHPMSVQVLFDGFDLFEGGAFFLAEDEGTGRLESLLRFLNQSSPFVPFHTDAGMELINLDAVVAVRLHESEAGAPSCILDVQTTVDGLHLVARHVPSISEGAGRLQDYLNQGWRFLRFEEQGQAVYLNIRHIARVREEQPS